MVKEAQTVSIDGRRLRVSNLDKIMYPETGTTKADVLRYYQEIAPFLLPHVRDRPVTRKRWVHGVGTEEHPGAVFFNKNLDSSAPDWIARRTVQHRDHANDYALADGPAALAWFAQTASLELHVPQWRFGDDGQPLPPDRLVLDLDPGEGVGVAECVEVAHWARELLQGMGLEPVPVTSGSKGIHLYAALDGRQDSDDVSAVAHELARALEADHPDLVISRMKRADRVGKVFVDWSQNSAAKTTVAPYSLRGRLRPTVAVPRTWDELDDPALRHLELEEVLERMRGRDDPLAALAPRSQDPLARYREMRPSGRSPEPRGERIGPTGGRTFVIQEHHARRLHWDLRLEHEGVLRSWALPKGVPDDPGVNHLAVPTEDHPLEYATFEGTIPRGEYGAGEMTIWDTGDYEPVTWQPGKVTVELRGRPGGGLGGSRRVALFATGEDRWMIHRMPNEASGTTPRRSPSADREKEPRAHDDEAEEGIPSPMLAASGGAADLAEGDWAFEMKWDGYRALVDVRGETVRVYSRNGHDLADSVPELRGLAAQLRAADALLDGEIVALDAAGRPSFSLLQRRMGGERTGRVHLMLFDVLRVDGRDVTGETYDDRRRLLHDAVDEGGLVHVPSAHGGSLEEARAASAAWGLEGVVAKERSSPYRPGRRSASWIKLPHARTQEVVVVGWRTTEGGAPLRSLLLAVRDGDEWRYVGRVGSGFRDRDRREIPDRLAALETPEAPLEVPRTDGRDARWVRPELVGEVALAGFTGEGRLRQARWRGWRTDKTPEDAVVAP